MMISFFMLRNFWKRDFSEIPKIEKEKSPAAEDFETIARRPAACQNRARGSARG
jgi:hypothetical protein